MENGKTDGKGFSFLVDKRLILSPLPNRRIPRVPVGVITDYGGLSAERGAKVIYTGSAVHALRAVRKHGGYAFAIKGYGKTRWLSFHYAGLTVYPCSSFLSLQEVSAFRDYCHAFGIKARSLQSMGFYLLRQSLAGSLEIDEGADIPFRRFPAGAFVYSREGIYDNVYQSDIRAAYTSALGSIHPARSFSEVRRISQEEISDHLGAFALVNFRISSSRLPFSIVPSLDERGGTTFGAKGWRRTVLSANDLRLATSVGVRVTVERAWLPSVTTFRPFSAFLQIVRDARSTCGRPAKIATNSVWGVFSAGSRIRRYEFRNGQTRHMDLPARSKICPPLAHSVVSSLRERIVMEGFGRGCLHAHTDGIIATHPIETGDDIGDWRLSGKYDQACIVRSNCYSLTTGEKTIYRISGSAGNQRHFRERLMSIRDGLGETC